VRSSSQTHIDNTTPPNQKKKTIVHLLPLISTTKNNLTKIRGHSNGIAYATKLPKPICGDTNKRGPTPNKYHGERPTAADTKDQDGTAFCKKKEPPETHRTIFTNTELGKAIKMPHHPLS